MNLRSVSLYHTYPNGVEALRGLSLEIDAGEQVAIVGQNGSGKTSLVKHFNGLLQPSQGEVWVGELDTRQVSVAKLAARVGYVFQNPDEQLFCRTVAEEVAFGPHNLGFDPEKSAALCTQALAWTELAGQVDANPYDLSATWRKMVALAAVLSMDTPIVILDEPTTGQDAASVARIARVVAHLRAQGKTVIAITHDIDFAAENFARVIALAQGQVLLDGPARDVLGQTELLGQTYVDPPQLTRLAQRLGMPRAVLDAEDFLAQLRQLRPPGD